MREGVCAGYHPNGKIAEYKNYKNGLREGKHYQYYDNGLLKSELVYEKDKVISKVEYNEKGIKHK